MYDVTKRKSSILLTSSSHIFALFIIILESLNDKDSLKIPAPFTPSISSKYFKIMANDNDDTLQFDNLLNLEDQYYQEGLELGIADGTKAGRIEGRLFGIEKGFEKFFVMGEMNGRASYLLRQSHLSPSSSTAEEEEEQGIDSASSPLEIIDEKLNVLLKRFEDKVQTGATTNPRVRAKEDHGERLTKQIQSLFDLTDSATLSSLNTEEATEDFDERRKRAKAKLIMIEKALDAKSSSSAANNKPVSSDSPLAGDEATRGAGASGVRLVRSDQGTTEKNIEDFGG